MPSTLGGAGYHADGKLPRLREVDFRLRSRARSGRRRRHRRLARRLRRRWSRSTRKRSASSASRAITPATRSRPGAAVRTRCRPAPTCSSRRCTVPAAERLGYHPYRAPTGANSVPYDGRPACNNCGFCAFYGCPIEAKGDPIAPLRRALHTGLCEIRPESVALEVLLDATGKRSRGVRYLDADAQPHEVSARCRRRRRAARSRRRACSCAATSATRPISSAAT